MAAEARLASFGYRSTLKAKPPLKTRLNKVKNENEKVKGFMDIHRIPTIPHSAVIFPKRPIWRIFVEVGHMAGVSKITKPQKEKENEHNI